MKKFKQMKTLFTKLEFLVFDWMNKKGTSILTISIGIIFFWFGFLKYFKGLSPAETFAIKTINDITYNLLSQKIIIYGLATWEVIIGLGMLLNKFMRFTILLLFLHLIGTIMPLFLYTSEIFTVFPVAMTLEGQYIVKNLIIIAASIVIAGRHYEKINPKYYCYRDN